MHTKVAEEYRLSPSLEARSERRKAVAEMLSETGYGEPGGQVSVLVCATGGHLAQLYKLSDRLDVIGAKRLWVTFDTPQSRSLLADEHVIFVPYTAPRDVKNTVLNARVAWQLLNGIDCRVVVSTGNAIAGAFLPLARSLGIPAVYIESAARASGPSLTGQMMARVPGILRFTQYKSWNRTDFRYIGSVFDEFESSATPSMTTNVRKLVVTLGTIEGYGFSRLIRRLLEIVPPAVEVIWQVGDTETGDLGIDGVRAMPAKELFAHIGTADAVVAHAGIGSALGALEAGKCPILVPRRTEFGEHVDDHQAQIAGELAGRGVAMLREVEQLTFADIQAAAAQTVQRTQGAPLVTGIDLPAENPTA